MKKFALLLFAALMAGKVIAKTDREVFNNQILYVSIDDKAIDFSALKEKSYALFGTELLKINESIIHGAWVLEFQGDVTQVGAGVFKNCTNLKAIFLPSTVKSIGDYAFQYCNNLDWVELGGNEESIGEYAFHCCENLSLFNGYSIPNSVSTIGEHAFDGCSSLEEITISSNVKTLNDFVFSFCHNLSTIIIPSSIESIEAGTFAFCKGLKSVIFEGSKCSNNILLDAFDSVGTIDNPVNLTLPVDWPDALRPKSCALIWNGGYFYGGSVLDPQRQTVLDAIMAAMLDHTNSAYLSALVAEETKDIKAAVDEEIITSNKEQAIEKLRHAVPAYEACKTEMLGNMGAEQKGLPAVKISEGEKTVTLYNPEKVEFIKVTGEE